MGDNSELSLVTSRRCHGEVQVEADGRKRDPWRRNVTRRGELGRIFEGIPRPAGKYSYGLTDTLHIRLSLKKLRNGP